MDRRGERSERGDLNREIQARNAERERLNREARRIARRRALHGRSSAGRLHYCALRLASTRRLRSLGAQSFSLLPAPS